MGPLPFVFNDIMGLQPGDLGVHTDDIISILEGHVTENYKVGIKDPFLKQADFRK